MIKKRLENKTNKELYQAKAADKLYRFLLSNGQVRGVIVNCTHMINEMRANHQLGVLETYVLGQAYIAASLMTANLKGNDRMSLKVECEGPIKGLSVEANAFGEVRGFLKNPVIPLDKPLESFDLAPFYGTGYLTISRVTEFAKHPYTGHVKLVHGNLASDLANYHLTSEQTPTAFNLGIQFDPQGDVIGAGGLFLQAMPDADAQMIGNLEIIVETLPSIGKYFAEEGTPVKFVEDLFHCFQPQILGNRRVEFFCRCQKDSVARVFTALDKATLEDILINGPFPVEIKCDNCATFYHYEKEEIEEIRAAAEAGKSNAEADTGENPEENPSS